VNKQQNEKLSKDKSELVDKVSELTSANQKLLKFKESRTSNEYELVSLRKELERSNLLIKQYEEKLTVERQRVKDWKRCAESRDPKLKNKKHSFFGTLDEEGTEKKESLMVYAPMTEMLSEDEDETNEVLENEKHFAPITVGETERYPDNNNRIINNEAKEFPPNEKCKVGKISFEEVPECSETSTDDEGSKSPSLLTRFIPPRSLSDVSFNLSRAKFNTSEDLFAETLPPPSKPMKTVSKINLVDDEFDAASTSTPLATQFQKPKFFEKKDTSVYKSDKKIQRTTKEQNGKKSTHNNTVLEDYFDKNEVAYSKNECMKTPDKPQNKGYKYVEVVRKKADREKLKGFSCAECEKFYKDENLTDSKKKEILNRCSRHRYQDTPPPNTPDEFWEVGFPSTQEYIQKGLLEVKDEDTPKENKLYQRRRKRIKYQ